MTQFKARRYLGHVGPNERDIIGKHQESYFDASVLHCSIMAYQYSSSILILPFHQHFHSSSLSFYNLTLLTPANDFLPHAFWVSILAKRSNFSCLQERSTVEPFLAFTVSIPFFHFASPSRSHLSELRSHCSLHVQCGLISNTSAPFPTLPPLRSFGITIYTQYSGLCASGV